MHNIFKLVSSFILLILLSLNTNKTEAQTIEILAGNAINGAAQGAILGAATMGVNNSSDFANIRVGVGIGSLYGIGMGVYDMTTGKGGPIGVRGLFNDSKNTSVIVLLDTAYGAAAGAFVATSVIMIMNKSFVDGLQYGASYGAWVGFGLGLVDAFIISERGPIQNYSSLNYNSNASGLIGLNFEGGSSFGFLNPTLVHTKNTNFQSSLKPAVDVLNFKYNF